MIHSSYNYLPNWKQSSLQNGEKTQKPNMTHFSVEYNFKAIFIQFIEHNFKKIYFRMNDCLKFKRLDAFWVHIKVGLFSAVCFTIVLRHSSTQLFVVVCFFFSLYSFVVLFKISAELLWLGHCSAIKTLTSFHRDFVYVCVYLIIRFVLILFLLRSMLSLGNWRLSYLL